MIKGEIESTRSVNGINIIKIAGDFTMESTDRICSGIEMFSKKNRPRGIVLDLNGVTEVDTAAFACVISLIKTIVKDPKRIGVINMNFKAEELIGLLKINQIINNFGSEPAAISFFDEHYKTPV